MGVSLQEMTKVCQPLMLAGLIRYFQPDAGVSTTEAYLYALGLTLSSMVIAIAHHPYFFRVQRVGMQMRVASCALIYQKVGNSLTN